MKRLLGILTAGTILLVPTIKHLSASRGDFPNDSVTAVQVQLDGKSIFAGKFTDGYIMRRNLDGTFDSTFTASWTTGGFNGIVNSLILQPDQKILVGGEFSRFDTSLAGYITRLTPEGTIDSDFARNTGTGFDDSVTAIDIQPNGKIWVAGKFSSFNGESVGVIARLLKDGSLDSSFQLKQKLTVIPTALTYLAQSNEVVIGIENQKGWIRIKEDGTVQNF